MASGQSGSVSRSGAPCSNRLSGYQYMTHIKFSGRIYTRVHSYQGLGVVEHPHGSKAWKTIAFQ